MSKRALAAALLLLLAPALAFGQTAIRPDQICNPACATPDITWGPGTGGYQIGSIVAWRTNSTATIAVSDFTSADLGRVVELTFAGPITATLPDATGTFAVGAGFTIQVGPGSLTLNQITGGGHSTINGLNSIKVGPYQSVGLISRGGNWYAQLSVPQPTTQTGTTVLGDQMTWGAGGTPPSFTAGCSQSSAWLGRAANSALDTTHKTAYDTLICGLVTDGVFVLGDALYIYAAPTTATALLNLLSTTNYNSTAFGSPAFVADAGFTGVNAQTTPYIDTGFNPVTATTPHYTRDSASLMAWSLTTVQATSTGGTALGAGNSAFTQLAQLDLYAPGAGPGFDVYVNVNATTSPPQVLPAPNTVGSWTGNRSGANAVQGYHNGAPLTVTNNTAASTVIPSFNFFTLGANINGTADAGGIGNQIAAIWIGGSLSPTQVSSLGATAVTSANAPTATGLIPRICTYLFAVHGAGSC